MLIERLSANAGERLRAIRLRALRDAPDAFATTLAEAEAWLPEIWSRQVEELATFVATARGSDVGMVRGVLNEQSPDTGYVISMWVATEARRQGIGSALIDAVIGWARSHALMRLVLDVGEANAPAIALYRRKGFAASGKRSTLPPPRDHIRQIELVLPL